MKITYIGGGNMASAMIGGMLSQGFSSDDIHVVEPDASKRAELAQQYGISCSTPDEALPVSQAIIFAIKPQQFRAVAQSILPKLNTALVISIAAGIRARDHQPMARWLSTHCSRDAQYSGFSSSGDFWGVCHRTRDRYRQNLNDAHFSVYW
ncbi:NAD(P)-binding domain-containing protein [Deefgea sp. CFH1-16]|uniref:pyrroline-5-carboxylate reductase family protein n=1 Tax=Deefgea sp. CFH1-16 TaxID=2675457 RepID=UPI0019402DF0